MSEEGKKKYSDFSNVESLRNELVPEETPEGPYGSPIRKDMPVEGKSTPWEKGQRRKSQFTYAYKDFHQDLPRKLEGSHPLHDHEGDVKPEQEND
ncbi:hypothetical protein NC797_00325 [Aquibacillus sp. 3ASR75-11]|uniref:Cytosolic protein n=1 Tax=Terrihalobacillus insolitus TaxID=2950438 RepID=A0A9X4ALY6_9BACI|nr:hypothetical protein [Terrihalobacillus insolitus]MDC3412357.1 hypothetical protein [Terrihalobacillus insolitus]MDC3422950.1 hypothetical protein [Terrihalobacillus insolitus]